MWAETLSKRGHVSLTSLIEESAKGTQVGTVAEAVKIEC